MVITLRNRIKEARQSQHLTQEALADLIGVTRQTIGLIEKEKYNPTMTICLNLSHVLKRSLDDLFWLEEETK